MDALQAAEPRTRQNPALRSLSDTRETHTTAPRARGRQAGPQETRTRSSPWFFYLRVMSPLTGNY